MACHFQAKSLRTYFQKPTHQISLFASLNTFNNFFLYKTQKQIFFIGLKVVCNFVDTTENGVMAEK